MNGIEAAFMGNSNGEQLEMTFTETQEAEEMLHPTDQIHGSRIRTTERIQGLRNE